MATIKVTGVDGNAYVKNSRVAGIQYSDGELPSQIGISNMDVKGVTADAYVHNSVVAGINQGQMGSIENRQQTYNIGNAHGVVDGQDMRGPSADQGGITGQKSGPIAVFKGKGDVAWVRSSDIYIVDIAAMKLHHNTLQTIVTSLATMMS